MRSPPYSTSPQTYCGLVGPRELAIDGAGNVWTVSSTAGRRQHRSASAPTRASFLGGILVHRSAIVLERHRHFDKHQQRWLSEACLGSANAARGVAVDPSGNVWVGSNASARHLGHGNLSVPAVPVGDADCGSRSPSPPPMEVPSPSPNRIHLIPGNNRCPRVRTFGPGFSLCHDYPLLESSPMATTTQQQQQAAQVAQRIPGEKSLASGTCPACRLADPRGGHFLARQIRSRHAALRVHPRHVSARPWHARKDLHARPPTTCSTSSASSAQLGVSVCMFLLGKAMGWAQGHRARSQSQDYGTKFLIFAGLLNIISAIDAHSLASGRKHDLPNDAVTVKHTDSSRPTALQSTEGTAA